MTGQPVLSIGIIFRDDIRSIERCLKALQPLRDAVPSELVMADTGSGDGSREIAERYADILFDFPWVNDFSAARNAVMDRCSGIWYFSVDTDEYLDPDIQVLTAFLLDRKHTIGAASLEMRNYSNYELEGDYRSFNAIRLLRMSTGLRYHGAIHEDWRVHGKCSVGYLADTVLHHDGYADTDPGKLEKKYKRNIALLRKRLEEEPEDLRAIMQFFESGSSEHDLTDKVREGVALIEAKKAGWRDYGPAIMRHAVLVANNKSLPELEKWIERAEELFPDSYFTTIDVGYVAAHIDFRHEEYDRCIRRGEKCLTAYADYRAGRDPRRDRNVSVLLMAPPTYEQGVRLLVARACLETGEYARAYTLLEELDCAVLNQSQVRNLVKVLRQLYSKTERDTAALVRTVWESLSAPLPTEKQARERTQMFVHTAHEAFEPEVRAAEKENPEYFRLSYHVFATLNNELGIGAALLDNSDTAEYNRLLDAVEEWESLPAFALSHALRMGAQFPPSGRTMKIEEMDVLAAQLAKDSDGLYKILSKSLDEEFAGSWQTLAWVRGLALAAVQACDWKDESAGLWLSRTLAKVEREFITGYYSPEVLQAGNLSVLPPMHRFGWYCVQAFDALEAGDIVGYVQFLREGLAAHKGMKKMVEFLTEHTPELELETAKPDTELRVLAEKIRTMLDAYSPDDPAVAALKASPVYQKVAYLIEGEGA